MNWNQKLWQRSLEQFPEFLEPLVAELGRRERREGAALYVQGLLTPGERKSVEPMAARLGVDMQKLQQLVADSPWDEQEVWQAIRQEVVPVLEPLASWIVDETGWLKQGDKSVGVAHQYCGAVGKAANCQVSVEVVVSDGEIAAPVAGRLYLPERWAADADRRAAAGVPPAVTFQTKPTMALELIREVLAAGVSRAPVLGDEVYGAASELRRGLRELDLEYFLNAGGDLPAWSRPVKTRRARKYWDVAEGLSRRPFPSRRGAARFTAKRGMRWRGVPPMAPNAAPGWAGCRCRSTATWIGTAVTGRNAGWWWTGRRERKIPITCIWPG